MPWCGAFVRIGRMTMTLCIFQRPSAWISWDEARETMLRWAGHKIMLLELKGDSLCSPTPAPTPAPALAPATSLFLGPAPAPAGSVPANSLDTETTSPLQKAPEGCPSVTVASGSGNTITRSIGAVVLHTPIRPPPTEEMRSPAETPA
jgi:hypothetical protein